MTQTLANVAKLSPAIEQDLAARGVAQVLVYLKSTPLQIRAVAATSATARLDTEAAQTSELQSVTTRLAKHFTHSEASMRSQLLEAATGSPGQKGTKRRAIGPASHLNLAKSRRRDDLKNLVDAGVSTPSFGESTDGPMLFPNLGIMVGTVTAAGALELADEPDVQAVTGAPMLSLIRPPVVRKAAKAAAVEWGVRAIKAPQLWKKGYTGKGVLVGHLDTGVDGKHKALAGAIASFADFDAMGRQHTPPPDPYDSDDHGTHTAATIAGRPANGRQVGIAPGCDLASAVVIEGGDVVTRVLGGMDWAIGQGVKVLSMSLGFRGYWPDFLVLTQIIRERGALPVFAVGNEGAGTSRSPGNYAEALAVGAYDEKNAVAWFSGSQSFQRAQDPQVPDLVAPGVDIVSAKPGGGYQSMDGTSMATPHVAGLAALLFSAKPEATVDEVEAAIFGSCTRKSNASEFRVGRGMPDGMKALKILLSA